MNTKQKSFIFYDDDLKCIDYLSDKQIGVLFKAVAASRLGREIPDLSNDPAISILFYQISTHMAINEEKYRKSCERNAKAARKRWENRNMQKDADASECIQTNANGCYNDNDIDDDIDDENDNANGASALNSGNGAEAPTITVDALLEKYRKIIAERASQQHS